MELLRIEINLRVVTAGGRVNAWEYRGPAALTESAMSGAVTNVMDPNGVWLRVGDFVRGHLADRLCKEGDELLESWEVVSLEATDLGDSVIREYESVATWPLSEGTADPVE